MGSVFKSSGVKILAGTAIAATLIFTAIAGFSGLTASDAVKLNPVSFSLESSGAWVDDASVWSLSDRDTTTAYAPATFTRLLITLPAQTDLKTLKIYGSAAYSLKVYEGSSGTWKPISGLDSISLKNQTVAWNSGAKVSHYEHFGREPSLKTALACEIIFQKPIREIFPGIFREVEQKSRKQSRILIERLDLPEVDPLTVRKLGLLKTISNQKS